MAQFIRMFMWEYPQAQESGKEIIPAPQSPPASPAWPGSGDLGGDTVVLAFGHGFVFKRSYIQSDSFLQSYRVRVPRDLRAGPGGVQKDQAEVALIALFGVS